MILRNEDMTSIKTFIVHFVIQIALFLHNYKDIMATKNLKHIQIFIAHI